MFGKGKGRREKKEPKDLTQSVMALRALGGKKKSGRTSPGSRWLRQVLVPSAWAASRSKKSYLAAQYRRLAARRGKKRALIAVGHSILVLL
jgi:hypothetical protein